MEKQATRQDRKESAEKELLQGLTEREVAGAESPKKEKHDRDRSRKANGRS